MLVFCVQGVGGKFSGLFPAEVTSCKDNKGNDIVFNRSYEVFSEGASAPAPCLPVPAAQQPSMV